MSQQLRACKPKRQTVGSLGETLHLPQSLGDGSVDATNWTYFPISFQRHSSSSAEERGKEGNYFPKDLELGTQPIHLYLMSESKIPRPPHSSPQCQNWNNLSTQSLLLPLSLDVTLHGAQGTCTLRNLNHRVPALLEPSQRSRAPKSPPNHSPRPQSHSRA